MPLPTAAELVTQLAEYVEWDATDPNLVRAAATAVALVGGRVTGNGANPTAGDAIPDAIGMEACVAAAAELFYRRTARHGLVNLGGEEGTAPARIAKDPMALAWPLLSPFVGLGVGG